MAGTSSTHALHVVGGRGWAIEARRVHIELAVVAVACAADERAQRVRAADRMRLRCCFPAHMMRSEGRLWAEVSAMGPCGRWARSGRIGHPSAPSRSRKRRILDCGARSTALGAG